MSFLLKICFKYKRGEERGGKKEERGKKERGSENPWMQGIWNT